MLESSHLPFPQHDLLQTSVPGHLVKPLQQGCPSAFCPSLMQMFWQAGEFGQSGSQMFEVELQS
jgi:hypothetical protein